MTQFKYKGKKLFAEKNSLLNIARRNTTPFYLYSEKQIRVNYNKFYNIFSVIDPLICFSVKSNSNLSILKILKKLGSGADVVSGGELLRVLKAGITPNKISQNYVKKSDIMVVHCGRTC